MKNLIPLFLAILFIGAGCVFEKPPVSLNSGEAIATPRLETFLAVVTVFDAESGVGTVGLADGSSEQVQAGAVSTMDASSKGSLFRLEGTRDPSTRVVSLSSATSLSQNVVVVSPEPGATVTSPLIVTGFARVFEGQFGWRIMDSTGVIVATGYAMTRAEDVGSYGPFSFEVFLPALTAQAFSLQVFSASPKDGTDQDVVTVDLNLLSTKTKALSVFFSNPQKDRKNCRALFPVAREIAETSAVGRASLYELLKGPTPEEKAQGYVTRISPDATLRSLVISDREARVDFSDSFRFLRFPCTDDSARAQVTQTIEQFGTVDSVDISVNGIPFGSTK